MKHLLVAAALLVCFSSAAHSQIPRLISYQGILAASSGGPVPDGAHIVRVRIYGDSVAGSPIFNEIQGIITVKGAFNMNIGSETPLPDSLAFSRPYYLGLTIDNGAELMPRTMLTTAPYAFRATTADGLSLAATVQGSQLAGAAAGDLGGSYPAPTVSGLQSRPLDATAPATGQVLQWNGTSWTPQTVVEPPTSFNVLGLTFQTLTTSVYQNIDFTYNNTSGGFDDGGNFNLTTDEFTAPTAGDYFFSAIVTLDTRSKTPNDIYLAFAVNGNTSAYTRFYTVAAGYPNLQSSMALSLKAGDKVSLQIEPGVAGISTMGGNSYGVVRMSGFKIH